MTFNDIKKLPLEEFANFICKQRPCVHCGIKDYGCRDTLVARLSKLQQNGKTYYENVLAKPLDKFAEWLCLQQGGCNICQYRGYDCKERIVQELQRG